MGSSGKLITTTDILNGTIATADIADLAISARGAVVPTAAQTTTSTSAVAMTGSSIAMTIAGTNSNILLLATGSVYHSAAGGLVLLAMGVDGTSQGAYTICQSPSINAYVPFGVVTSTSGLSAGSHTFTLMWNVQSGTGTLAAAYFTAIELKK